MNFLSSCLPKFEYRTRTFPWALLWVGGGGARPSKRAGFCVVVGVSRITRAILMARLGFIERLVFIELP
jgi:hypothetical protein